MSDDDSDGRPLNGRSLSEEFDHADFGYTQ